MYNGSSIPSQPYTNTKNILKNHFVILANIQVWACEKHCAQVKECSHGSYTSTDILSTVRELLDIVITKYAAINTLMNNTFIAS